MIYLLSKIPKTPFPGCFIFHNFLFTKLSDHKRQPNIKVQCYFFTPTNLSLASIKKVKDDKRFVLGLNWKTVVIVPESESLLLLLSAFVDKDYNLTFHRL